ncbi:hypothetical protein B9Z55_008130 [Caenorhabditis nigoni]|uniref:Uncharacterized protein n=1 Tax=Caenorhabditis nigoni TaxID=1611254 RepID=A0A2G5VDA7_9PELO|nr:hypothetical protein B9Z55_008130 [Caenorhabditis nigoni]
MSSPPPAPPLSRILKDSSLEFDSSSESSESSEPLMPWEESLESSEPSDLSDPLEPSEPLESSEPSEPSPAPSSSFKCFDLPNPDPGGPPSSSMTDHPSNPLNAEGRLAENLVKSIFEHMKTDIRMHIAQEIPALQDIESSVPISINRLCLDGYTLVVDETVYTLDTHDPCGAPSDYINFAMKSKRHVKVERIQGGDVHEAMVFLMNKLFGKRPQPITVGYLGIENKPEVLPFPEHLRFLIDDLKINHNAEESLNAISPFLDSRSFPLDTVLITGTRTKGNYNHKIIQGARNIEIVDFSSYCSWMTAVQEFHCNQVHVQANMFRPADFIKLMEALIRCPREAGTFISAGVDKYETVERIMMKAKENVPMVNVDEDFKGCPDFPDVLLIPVTKDKQLALYATHNLGRYTYDGHFSTYDVNLSVLSI